MRSLVIDFGTSTSAAVVVGPDGAWVVPDPSSGEGRWRPTIHCDGPRIVAGAAAEQRRRADPDG